MPVGISTPFNEVHAFTVTDAIAYNCFGWKGLELIFIGSGLGWRSIRGIEGGVTGSMPKVSGGRSLSQNYGSIWTFGGSMGGSMGRSLGST